MHHTHSATCTHHPHHHHPGEVTSGKQRQLFLALILLVVFAGVELGTGLLSHSLALVAESGHLLSDGFALGLALLATWLSRSGKTDRPVEAWAALVNGLGLLVLAGWVAWEAITRLQAPVLEIASLPMLLTAIGAAVVNGINIALLHQGSDHDLNLRAAFLHVLADALSSVGVMVAALVIAVFHWYWVDGVISLAIAVLISVSAFPLVVETLKALGPKASVSQ